MHKKNKYKAIVAIAVAIALLVPGAAAVANVGTFGTVPNSEITGNLKNSYNTDTTTILPTLGTIEVDDDNPDPDWYDATHVRTIPEGVTNASAGWTVYVYNGTYPEWVRVTKQLDFVGESRENVIVAMGIFIYEPVENVSFDSFTVTRSGGGYGIHPQNSANITITNCDIHGCTGWDGIYIQRTPYVNIINCNVYNNGEHGILIGAANVNVVNCNVYDNGWSGIYFWGNYESECSITGCNAYNNGENGIGLLGCSNVNVANCDVSYNGQDGIDVNTDYQPSEYNTITECNAYGNIGNGIHLDKTSDSEISYCTAYGNTENGIVIGRTYGRRNIITNCDVYNNDGAGIHLQGQSVENNIIANCTVHDNNVFETNIFLITAGIHLNGGNNNEVTNCTVSNNNGMGIFLSSSQQCTLIDNTISNDDFLVFGLAIEDYLHNIGTSNMINGEPIFYLIGQNGVELNEAHNFGFLALIGCTNMIVKNSEIYGMLLFGTATSTISNVDCHGSFAGPLILGSLYNNFIDCDIYNSIYGITLLLSSDNTFTNCKVHDNMYGFTFAMGCTGNDVLNCNVSYNTICGISSDQSMTGEISSCTVYNNGAGIYLVGSPNNLIYNNYFNNPVNAFDDVSAGTNTWNIAKTAGTNIVGGPFLGGNFWSDYAGEDTNGDGLGDTLLPYNCNGFIANGGDSLPLVQVPVVPAVVSISPSTQTVNKGEAFTFSVYVEPGDTPIKGMAFRTLSFDQTLIYVDSIVEGDIAELNPFDPGIIDNVNGEITDAYGFVKTGTVTTPGSFIVVSCHALQQLGTSDLVLIEVDISDVDAQPISTTVNNGEVTVEQIYHTLDITIVGSGTVICDPIGDPPGTYEENTVVTLTPDPAVGWVFAGWSGPDASEIVDSTITMTKNMEITATFIFGDEEPPVITGITLTTSDPLDTDPLFGWEKVTCTVTDNVEVRDVKLVVTYLETTPVDYPMIKDGDTYSYEITLTDVGDYTYHIWADDTSDNNATSTPEAFVLPPNWDIVVDLENRECYFYDLGAVVAAYGDTGSPGWIREDWNNNGEVYFYDLGEIVKRYGQRW